MKKKNKLIEALYVHIPFCEHICYYCDFTKMLIRGQNVDGYLEQLELELRNCEIEQLKTIYIGGGTPTALNLVALERLFLMLKPYSDGVSEYTIEANVENLTAEKLVLMKKYGINRLSLGVQSLHDQTLKAAGRLHSSQEAIAAIELAKSLGINNISIDLIYGLPGQKISELEVDLDRYLASNIPHISTYALSVLPGTVFNNQKVEEISEDLSRQMYDLILNKLRSHGYIRYEVSNFAKPGYESKHNLIYWRNKPYYGVGLGASGYENNIRYTKTKNLNQYLAGKTIHEEERINKDDELDYYLITNLRLADGFSQSEFQQLFGFDFTNMFKKPLEKLVNNGLVINDNQRIYCSDEGIIKLNSVLIELLKDR